MGKRTSTITAETFRPERVDERGAPERLVTGDAPSSSTPSEPPAPDPAPAPEPAPPAEPTPEAPVARASSPTPAEPAGLTTAEIVAALGESVRSGRVRVTREPSPYIEGGEISQSRGFFSDLYRAGTMGDSEARRRAMQFQDQLRAYITAASTTTSDPEIIAPAWGGAWYVDQIAMGRPCVSAFSSATITDNRPIPVPAFQDTTPASLVADHVEGTPDTPGTVNLRQVTVTPRAKSGRSEVSRELLDASPALADRIVSTALRESYSESCESTMAGVLEAGASAGPAGGADAAALELAIRMTLGLLPGTRHLPGRVVLPSSHAWGALVGANDSTGRPLMPYLGYGPTNAPAVAGAAYATGAIAGTPAAPAWALNPGSVIVGAGPADAMSFESSMLEFRFAEKSGPELVEFNVWGYFGAVVLQAKGVVLVTTTAAADAEITAPAASDSGNGAEAKSDESSHARRSSSSGK
jgi:hypothetical protein